MLRISRLWFCLVVAGFGCASLLRVVSAVPAKADPPKSPTVTNNSPQQKPKIRAANVPSDHAEKMTQGLELFRKRVRSVLKQHCVDCHGGDSTEAHFDLTDRDRLIRGGNRGPGIEVGHSRESLLLQLITHAKKPHMPQGDDKLPADVIADISRWIDLGAPYDSPLVEKQTVAPPWYEKKIDKEVRRHWAYQPLQAVSPPTPKNSNWCRTPVDPFILQKLESAGIEPNAPLSREKLIRRVYFDLLGLPPTADEVEAFVRDARSDAYERLVDRLLASPRYGERWARPWLDLARFAESHGYEQDYDRPSAYQYRDFVIEALNRDLPYDTFVKWQIAGDEYEPENNLALKATGYLAAGVHPTQITANEVEKSRYDELDDVINNIGTTMLGLTIGCCRCHDHKYDALPQGDYYRFLSTFSTTVRSDVDLVLNREEYTRQLQNFDAVHRPLQAKLDQFDAQLWPARFSAWVQQPAPEVKDIAWTILDPASLETRSKSPLVRADDGSLRIQKEPASSAATEAYTVRIKTRLAEITAFRLELFADPRLPHRGPGRAGDGSVLLTGFSAELTEATSVASNKTSPTAPKKVRSLKFSKAHATNSDTYGSIAGALDDNPNSGWIVPAGKTEIAAFELEKPIEGTGSDQELTFRLEFQKGSAKSPAQFRLSATTKPTIPDYTAAGIPESIVRILRTTVEKRSTDQQAAVKNWRRATDPERVLLVSAIQEHLARKPAPKVAKALISSEGLPAVRLHTQGADFFEKTYFLRRGDVNLKEGVASSSFLQVLMPETLSEKHWQTPPPAGSRTSYRRRALAEWLTDTRDGAGALLARVMVNRIWQGHLGRGIVATPSDFGVRGERPTHPELLDWLAAEFIRSGWSIKQMHRLILTSSVYRQSSSADPHKLSKDSGNRFFWRKQPRRLEAETIRDAMLAVSRQLDTGMFGPGTLDPTTHRRSIYFFVKRSKLVPMMQVFDAPDSLSGIGDRQTTTIAPQALLLMNNPQVRLYAKAFAHSLDPNAAIEAEAAVTAAYRSALARVPTSDELAASVSFINRQRDSYLQSKQPDAAHLALADFCQTLFCLNEFIYVD